MDYFHQQPGTAYFNEFDIEKAHWLRELMREGHIAPGTIDTRSIENVTPAELIGFVQHHFFAGIGVWSYAARLAGWPDDQPLRTLSCPCQPFSVAGKAAGFADDRNLWPAAAWHIALGRACPTFGEQVASRDGLAWLDVVSADLEAQGYAIAALDLCSASIGAPHIRQRLYFVADPDEQRWDGRRAGGPGDEPRTQQRPERLRDAGLLGHTQGGGCRIGGHEGSARSGGHPDGSDQDVRPGPTNGFWRDADWLFCRDGRWRPVEPGASPLVTGAPSRMGLLRGYGDAICAPLAAAFIQAYREEKGWR